MNEWKVKTIGVIKTPWNTVENMPIQPLGAKGVNGTIELFKEYVPGLKDIEGFSHLILIYQFHKVTDFKLHVIPFMDKEKRGMFATRAPKRPNAIGISTVEL